MSTVEAVCRCFALSLLLPVLCLQAQGPVAPEVIIDAIVTGKAGPVRDLAAKDFAISVDGHDQVVTRAALQSSAALPQRPNKHYLVLLFDSSTLNAVDMTRIRQQVERFLDAAASPDRYVAVLRWHTGMEVIQPFVTDTASLKKSLEKVGPSVVVGAGSQGTLDSGYTSASTGRAATGAMGNSVATAGAVLRTQTLLQSLAGLGDSLLPIRGRKAVLFFTGGGYALSGGSGDVSNYLKAAMLALNRANVGLHGISNDSSLSRLLSDSTGGTATRVTETLSEPLIKLAQEQDANYVVSFTPTGELREGCHQVRIKVPNDLDVQARREYCAPRLTDPLEGTEVGKALETRAGGAAEGKMAVSIRIPYYYTAPDRALAHVALDIAPEGVKFAKQKGKFVSEIDVVGVSAKADGSAGPRFSEVVKLSYDKQEQVDALLKSHLYLEHPLELPVGRYTFQVAVASGNAFGRAALPVEVAAHDPSRLELGPIAFGRVRRGGNTALTAGLDPVLLEGSSALTVGAVQVLPLGTTRFPATASAVIYTEVNAPAALSAGPGVNLQFRYLDRATGAVKLDSGAFSAAKYARAGSPVIPVAFDIPLKDLGPGRYQVQMRASAGAAAVIGSADFEVY